MANLPSTEALGARATAAARRAGITFDLVDDGAVAHPLADHGRPFGSLAVATGDDVDTLVGRSRAAFTTWRATPAPRAGRSSAASPSCSASTRPTSPRSSRSRPARSARRRSARCRR